MITSDSDLSYPESFEEPEDPDNFEDKIWDDLRKTIGRIAYGHKHDLKARPIITMEFRRRGGSWWHRNLVRLAILPYSSHRIRRTLFKRRIIVSRTRQYGITTRRELLRYEPGFVVDKHLCPVRVTDPFGNRVQLAGCWSIVRGEELYSEEAAKICADFAKVK